MKVLPPAPGNGAGGGDPKGGGHSSHLLFLFMHIPVGALTDYPIGSLAAPVPSSGNYERRILRASAHRAGVQYTVIPSG